MCKYELPTSRLYKVIVRQTKTQTYRQTESTEIKNHAASWVVKNSTKIFQISYAQYFLTFHSLNISFNF